MKKFVLQAFFVGMIIICMSGCRFPQITNFVSDPPAHMIKKKAVNASVTILSWKDERKYVRSTTVGLVFIPLWPFGWNNTQGHVDGHENNLYTLKPKERYQAREFQHYSGYSWGALEEYTIPKVLERYLQKTSTFKNVYFSLASKTKNYEKADYIIKGTLYKWLRHETSTFYGLGAPGMVVVSLLYIPWKFSYYDVDIQFELIDNKSDKVLCSERYNAKIQGPWRTFPFAFGAIAYRKGNFTSQYLKPFVTASIEKFVSKVQNTIQNPGNENKK